MMRVAAFKNTMTLIKNRKNAKNNPSISFKGITESAIVQLPVSVCLVFANLATDGCFFKQRSQS